VVRPTVVAARRAEAGPGDGLVAGTAVEDPALGHRAWGTAARVERAEARQGGGARVTDPARAKEARTVLADPRCAEDTGRAYRLASHAEPAQ
jgi:hypothetical protein